MHGEPEAAEALRDRIDQSLGWTAVVPRSGERAGPRPVTGARPPMCQCGRRRPDGVRRSSGAGRRGIEPQRPRTGADRPHLLVPRTAHPSPRRQENRPGPQVRAVRSSGCPQCRACFRSGANAEDRWGPTNQSRKPL
ncbi:hypothetical protein ACIBO9_13570 [Streptomyces prunicolor]|uniref:hypothetical protein n=1 Tax=Streptomyces prunicolor TaxID=67348 RepID=UPI0037CFD5F0